MTKKITTKEARQGETSGRMRIVLFASVIASLAAMVAFGSLLG